MTRSILVTTVVLCAVLSSAQPASAITNGSQDTDNTFANVGSLVFLDPDGSFEGICSGTLLTAGSSSAPAQFLTAGHCTAAVAALGIPPSDVFVSFDPKGATPVGFAPSGLAYVDPTGVTLVPAAAYSTHPAYPARPSPSGFDLGVVTLKGRISDYYTGLTAVTLPPAGFLDQDERGANVVGVGYGMQAFSPNGSLAWTGWRNYASIKIAAVQPDYLHTAENSRATGLGGACRGDSGGPMFYEGFQVAVTTWGAARCQAEGLSPRLDRPAVQSWLSQFLG